MQSLAFNSLYRKDGSERMYSHEKILGLGIPELQFNTLWPKALHWLGPCPESPVFDHPEPQYEQGRKHILVSLGTQVPWAKERAEKVFRKVASLLPEYMFHFTLGRTALKEPRRENNLHCYGYLPYTPETFRHYDVIVNHGGIGAMYTSIIAGVPQLVWPQDFDQPDCAAQVNYHKVGLRTNGKTQDIVIKIKRLMENEIYRKRSVEFQEIIKRYHPGKTFVELLEKRFS